MLLRALTCGWVTGPMELFLAGETGRLRAPVPAFLIEHAKGTVLFDTGLHPATRDDPADRLGALAGIFDVDLAPEGDVAGRLGHLGIACERVSTVVLSHLHFDHAGGLAVLPNARVVVQRAEWAAGADPDLRAANAYDPRDFDLGHDLLLVDGAHDLFGDGRVVCIPTPGHTPGHQSLRVRMAGGDVVLTADACYLARTLDEMRLPQVVHDAAAMRASLERLRRLRAGGARIVFGHDPEQWATIPQAPQAM